MALFKKDKTTATNIPELQEYYANQKTESSGKAWLLAIGSLLVTVVVLVGLFFGGRWGYRKATKKNDKTTVATSQTGSNNTSKTPPPTTSPTPTTTPTPSSTVAGTNSIAEGVAATQTPTTNTTAKAATTTAAATVPNTGPGDTIGLFAVVAVLSYAAHYTYTRRKLSK